MKIKTLLKNLWVKAILTWFILFMMITWFYEMYIHGPVAFVNPEYIVIGIISFFVTLMAVVAKRGV